MIPALAVAALLAAPALANEPTPINCPKFGSARCYGQDGADGHDCGGHPAHNLAYALRVGHLDYDWISGLLYNQGTAGPDHREWQWLEAPDPEDKDSWCLEDCRVVREDPKRKKERCAEPAKPAAPPPLRPPYPSMIRCFGGEDYTGGIDYSRYPLCGAPAGVTTPGTFPHPSFKRKPIRLHAPAPGHSAAENQECTGGNPKCICVKGDPKFNRYEGAAHAAAQKAFNGEESKPQGMTDAQATAKICEAYNAEPILSPSSKCRSQNDEIVLEDRERPVDRKHPDVSLDVVTAYGAFWRKAIAACEPGVH